ncbi:MAG: hypothetical protein SCK28_13730 [Bacillota bacterium]|nr:hypothetical protein [Bacillota bacterium]
MIKYLSPLLASFTFITIFMLALVNGVTTSTALWRSFISASVILFISYIAINIIIGNIFSRNNGIKAVKIEKETPKTDQQEFKPGIEHILSNNSQIDKDIIKLLESDPERAAELLKKMGAK